MDQRAVFLEHLKSPEAKQIIAAVAEDVRVQAVRRGAINDPRRIKLSISADDDGRMYLDSINRYPESGVKHDCPEYEKCKKEFGANLTWSCANCGFDPKALKDNEMVLRCELRLEIKEAGRNIAKLLQEIGGISFGG